jgi:hypothetical protein
MNNEEIGRYIKILSKINIPEAFNGSDQKVFTSIIEHIRDQIIKELSKQEIIIKDYIYIKNSIISINAIISLYSKNYIYLENEDNIEKHINNNLQRYSSFKSRTPDFNGMPIYVYMTTNLDTDMFTIVIENNKDNITKFVIFKENNKVISEILIENTNNIEKIFGEKIILDNITINEFEDFIKTNIIFFKNNQKFKNSIDINFE